jgi:hypothetical protein
MNGLRWILGVAALAASAGACIVETTDNRGDDDDGAGGSTPQTPYVGAQGVTINEVSLYQGLKRTLAQNGAQMTTSSVPLVAGRQGLLRVFYTATPDRVGQTVKGRLTIDGVEQPIEADIVLAAASNEVDLASTANFAIPPQTIGTSFGYRVELLDEEIEGSVDNAAAHYPVSGSEVHGVEGPNVKFRVILAPFRYDTDGSGRLPNLSPEMVESYRQRFLQLYPVADVEVTVREPTPWNQPIGNDGTGWQEVGFTVFQMRSQDGASDDVYYYGVFNPSDSFGQYCGAGCLLGVTLLNNDPPDTGSVGLRLALGVGFDEYATDTAAHELGHSHGRNHADCGPGLDPQSIDPAFPYPNGSIGVWGYDFINNQMIDPAVYSDIMGYCDTQWISDYNYSAFLARGKNVNLPRWHQGSEGRGDGKRAHVVVAYDGQSASGWTEVDMARTQGSSVTVRAVTESGASDIRGQFFRYDHLPGGWLVFEKPATTVKRIETSIEGRLVSLERP